MRYQQPYGVTDPNAPYINGNPAAGIEGSIPPAGAFEEPQREIVNLISLTNQAPTDSDLLQLAKAVQSGLTNYAADVGTQNAMVVALTPTLAGHNYFPGLIARVKAKFSNINDATHTTFTLDAGCGPAPVVRCDGSYPQSNDVPAGAVTQYVFDGTRWQIVNFLGTGGTGGGSNTYLVKIPYTTDTSNIVNTIIANFTPAITAINAGDVFLVKIANTVTGPTQMTVNALPAKNVVRNDGQQTPLGQSDLVAGAISLMVFDGVQFLVLSGGTPFRVPSALLQFLSTQNWTVPNGVYRLRAKVWGGGGGGAGSAAGRAAGAGGGGGGYSERICNVSPGLVIAITVGLGGAGASWGTVGNAGAPHGGVSAFGGFCSATGGYGGLDDAGTYGPIGQPGGSGSGGNINMTGEYGAAPLMMTVNAQPGGKGGAAAGGGGAGGGNSTGGPSQTAMVPGGGGEGCPNNYPGPGAPGVSGMVTVEY